MHGTKTPIEPNQCRQAPSRSSRFALVVSSTLCVLFAFSVGTASASKQVIEYFGTPPGEGNLSSGEGTLGGEFSFPNSVAVNNSGAGPARKGEIYVVDGMVSVKTQNPRIQRFTHDDNGTPANPYDDSYEFVSVWGAGVETGDANYEICTVASSCRAGVKSGGNGAFSEPAGIAVDQDTGNVYVSDDGNNRIDVYDGTGAFLRAFGWDVVASGPDNTGTGYEICVAANGDICKAGLPGFGIGQIKGSFVGANQLGIAVSQPDGNAVTGSVFLADKQNRRVDTYNLDGTSPSSFGTAATFEEGPQTIAVDSRGIVYASNHKNENEVERYDSENANGDGIGFLAPITAPPLIPSQGFAAVTAGLTVDPDSDGPGPDSDVLYLHTIAGGGEIQQFGPLNAPGLTAPPTATDDVHATSPNLGESGRGLAIDESDGSLYLASRGVGGDIDANGVYVVNTPALSPTASLESVNQVTASSASVKGSVDPNGGPNVSYRLEYSTDGNTWSKTDKVLVGQQEAAQEINAFLNPPPFGLEPSTLYHVRLVAEKPFQVPVLSSEATFTTTAALPMAESVGSPVRSASTARLEGRIDPNSSATTYHFEYGDEGPCQTSSCVATLPQAVGSGKEILFVSQSIEGLTANTTYHYRVVAESVGGTSFGEDATLSTRPSDEPLSHGHLPGPPGSDRAWEQVNDPDTGGNPVTGVSAISDNGDRAIYQVAGGNPLSETGTIFNQLFAERTPSGWQSRKVYPTRQEAVGGLWVYPAGRSDLSQLVAANFSGGAEAEERDATTWKISPGNPATKVFGVEQAQWGQFTGVSDDVSRIVSTLRGPQDPVHPVTGLHLYDITSGTPKLLDLLPDGTPTCGVSGLPSAIGVFAIRRAERWVSPDGSKAFFSSSGKADCGEPAQIFVRNIESEETIRISPPALSGSTCEATFLKPADNAVFFVTKSRLTSDDTAPENCGGANSNDIYRYDLGSGSLTCVTCVAPVNANVQVVGSEHEGIAVAEDGSRLYFRTSQRLLPGASVPGIYRIDVQDGDLAFVGSGEEASIGDLASNNEAISEDGTVLIFASSSPKLNAANGAQNAGTKQYYRYDDVDRSLVCVSCPPDGSAPVASVPNSLIGLQQLGPNLSPLDKTGQDLVFSTPTPLVFADQNTAKGDEAPVVGTDLYEWRDGKLLLVSDGLNSTPPSGLTSYPKAGGITPNGKDVFFTEAAQLTPDALDGYQRLYDARIDGGFEFPAPPKPCPLEVCQGIPKGNPGEERPGSESFAGPGNAHASAPTARCSHRKKNARGKRRCAKSKRHHRKTNNHSGRAAR